VGRGTRRRGGELLAILNLKSSSTLSSASERRKLIFGD